MPELKPSLFPYLYLRCLCPVVHGKAVGFMPTRLYTGWCYCFIYNISEELLIATNAFSKVTFVSSLILFLE
jgi:hypothetical protein